MLTEIGTNLTTYRFEPVRLDETKSYVCEDCGLRKSRKMTFEQTINPFNVNEDGNPKTRKEIVAELRVETASWQPDPHCGCARDERPEKQSPNIKMTPQSVDPTVLLAEAKKHYYALSCIEKELRDRLEGCRIRVKSDGREGFIRQVCLDRFSGNPSIWLFPWLGQKRNPKIEYGDGHQGMNINQVEFVFEDTLP